MTNLDYHDAHRRYVAAVVAELTTAGIAPTDWWADPNDPRDAMIACVAAPGMVCLRWDEETGWYWAPIDPARASHLNCYVRYMAEGVLPDADRVAAWFRGSLDGGEHAEHWPPKFRDFGDEDSFEAALRQAGGAR